MLVLIATLLIEISALVVYKYKLKGFTFTYSIFNLFEYTLFCMYYLKAGQNNKVKSWVKLSIPFFILFSVCMSFFVYHFEKYPVLNIDIEGLLLFIIYTHLLFNLEVEENKSIYANQDFWISAGILIFFGGAFVLFVLYPLLFSLDSDKAKQQYGFVLVPLNVILYVSIFIGIICSIRKKKYTIS